MEHDQQQQSSKKKKKNLGSKQTEWIHPLHMEQEEKVSHSLTSFFPYWS